MLEMADEVQETLGRQYGMPDDVTDEDLEAGKHWNKALLKLLRFLRSYYIYNKKKNFKKIF